MKKFTIIFGLLLLLSVLIAGCVQKPPVDSGQEEIDLIKELQEIERQLENSENGITGAVVADNLTDEERAELNALEDLERELNELDDSGNADILDDMSDIVMEEPPVVPPAVTIDTSSLQRVEVKETELVDLKVDAEDEDEDVLSYLFSPPLDENGQWQTDYRDEGEYVITIAASDGVNTVEEKILLVVTKLNRAPVIEEIPTRLDAAEGDEIRLDPAISDVNGDHVTVTYTTPFDNDGHWITDHTSSGVYDVTITASDGEEESVFVVTVTIKDVNVPPELTGVQESIFVNEGETVRIEPVVSDLDNDDVEVTISDPVGDDGVWVTRFIDNGVYTIVVSATDGKDTVSKEVVVTVADVNVPPKILNIVRR